MKTIPPGYYSHHARILAVAIITLDFREARRRMSFIRRARYIERLAEQRARA